MNYLRLKMKILLDTHTLLWFLENSKKLPRKAARTIEARRHPIYVSDITFFEISIKANIGKLKLQLDVRSFVDLAKRNFQCLPINHEHIITYQEISCRVSHRDPFDRMLIAIAKHEEMSLMSGDDKFYDYQDLINIIW